MTDYGALIPINVLTGFLGSGKTTLLQRLLTAPELTETAVLVNEFGEVGLDHHLLQHVAESTLLLDNGCLCCAIRGDLKDSLRDLLSRRERGEIPFFRRVAIETSGLADPVPIAYTLLAEPVIQHHFRLGSIVATVDAVAGAATLERHPESVKQAAVADRLVLTKTDLAEPADVAALKTALRRLNAAAPIHDAAAGDFMPHELLTDDIYSPDGRAREASRWLAAESDQLAHTHSDGVGSFCLTFEGQLEWTAFGIWLTMLLNRHGENVLRVKGLLDVAGVGGPLLINGVQHMVHPPSHLAAWPDGERRSRLIFITRGLSQERIEASFAAFNALGNPAQALSRSA